MARTATEKKQPRIKVPPSQSGARCVCCGKIYDTRRGHFSKTQSQQFRGNDGYIPFCNDCREEMFAFYTKKYGGDENEAIKRLAMFFDTFYSEELMEQSEHGRGLKINEYMGRLNIKQHIDKSYDTTIDEEKKAALASGQTSNTKITLKMIRFQGAGLDEQDYIYLEEQYRNLITRHECKTAAQEILFKRIAKAMLNCEKADATGDTKKIKEANDNLQNLMGSAQIKPNQTNDNSLAEVNTFGTLIQKQEEEEPIPEPLPEWKDVDGMGHYFRCWVLSPLLKMFNLPNPYQEEYEQEIERYTAHKPESNVEDSSDTTLREKIFGPGEGGGSS